MTRDLEVSYRKTCGQSRAACAGSGVTGSTASPFDHGQREQEETLPAPTEPGLREVNLRSDARQFLPAESCHSLSRRLALECSSPTNKALSLLKNPLNIFSKALQLPEVQLPAHCLFFPVSLLASSRSPACFISKAQRCCEGAESC